MDNIAIPNLVNQKTIEKINQIYTSDQSIITFSLWSTIKSITSFIYKKFIKDNLIIFIIITSISFFLLYRYLSKKERMENCKLSKKHRKFIRPTFNPYYPVSQQTSYSKHPPIYPNNIAIKSNGIDVDYTTSDEYQKLTTLDKRSKLGNDYPKNNIDNTSNNRNNNSHTYLGQYYPYTLPNYGSMFNGNVEYRTS